MLNKKANEARKSIIKMIYEAKSGHPGGSLSCIDILMYLYQKELKLTKDNINSNERNKLVLSKGHGAPALYAVLKEMSTGSLGQGISAAVGITLANKYKNNNYYTYVICGDGEFEEGQVYEALMAASHYQLSHFILFLDYNGLQIDGKIVDVIGPQPFLEKFLAFGFEVININGHDFDEIEAAVEMAKNSQKPTAIIAHTVKGKGISFMENEIEWHGKAPNRKEMEQALRELGGH